MPSGFDNIATKYDDGFSNTVTGKLQRKIVWNYLEKYLNGKKNLNILELNCGTGEDAILLAKKGHKVLATDVSERMLDVAKTKADITGLNNLYFSVLDISNPDTYPSDSEFDLVFSNFGGLNCISPDSFQKVIPEIAGLLKPKGHFIAVIMPRFCLWEWLYFSLKLKLKDAARRTSSAPVVVDIGGNNVDTWYYSPSEIVSISNVYFKKIKALPVGLFLPPSYLDNYFSKHPKFLGLLDHLEVSFRSFGAVAKYSDHFILDMEVKS